MNGWPRRQVQPQQLLQLLLRLLEPVAALAALPMAMQPWEVARCTVKTLELVRVQLAQEQLQQVRVRVQLALMSAKERLAATSAS